jgi:hypothetical protein
MGLQSYVKHCLDFSYVFSAPLPAWRNLSSASGRYQPSCTRIFWPAEGTSQPVTISKNWKNLSSALRRKKSSVQTLQWFSICSLRLPASVTYLKSRKGLHSGPFPIHYEHFLVMDFLTHDASPNMITLKPWALKH